MGKIICGSCNNKMSHERSGVYVLETFEDGKKPYKVWSSDLYYCKKCSTVVLTGIPSSPLREHYEEDFEEWVKKCEYSFK